MYKKYFGLEEKPFSMAPDPRFLFMSLRHREALGHLIYGIGEGGGFVQLTGEVGTGKTTISRCLLEQIPDHVDVALILNPKLNALELLATICDELHVEYEKKSASLKDLVDALNKHLLQTYADGRRTVLIIDEAQNLSTEVLEQIRLLTNLETTEHKLLQILLIGQPELRDLLAREDMRQLTQRITARYHLEPLSMAEMQAYIQHRLEVSGVQSKLFDNKALRAIYKYTSGVPRLINTLCDRALLGAYVEEARQVTRSIVRRAAAEALPEENTHSGEGGKSLKVLILLLLLLIFSALVWWQGMYKVAPAVIAEEIISEAPLITPVEPELATSPPVKAPPFYAVLNDFNGSGRMDAWRVLLASWGILLEEGAVYGAPCEQMHQYQLDCLQGKATLDHLRSFDRPSLIRVDDMSGRKVWLVLLSITQNNVELALGGQRYVIAVSDLADIWYGDYVLLWRPQLANEIIKKGLHDKLGISWLVERLDLALGTTEAVVIDHFDNRLKRRVIHFQQQQGLEPDGVVGTKTLIHLQNQRWSDDVPHLVSNRE